MSETILEETVESKAKPVVKPVVKPKKRRKKNFLNNSDLFEETKKSQANGRMTEKLGSMLLVLCDKYKKSKNGDFTRYTFFNEMKSNALENLVKNAWRKFNAEKYSNAFAFYTQCVHNSYLQYLTYEKRHRNIRDALLVAHGQTPSFKYLEEHAAKSHGDYSSDEVVDTGSELNYDTALVE